MNKNYLRFLAVCIFSVCTVSLSANLDAIKSRMVQRVGALDAMKASGAVGETNQGYLSIRGSLSQDQQNQVNAENSDRKEVYQGIASKTSVSISVVEKNRAEQIAKTSAKGIWLQKPDGQWYQK